MMCDGLENICMKKFMIKDVDTGAWNEYGIQYICPEHTLNIEDLNIEDDLFDS